MKKFILLFVLSCLSVFGQTYRPLFPTNNFTVTAGPTGNSSNVFLGPSITISNVTVTNSIKMLNTNGGTTYFSQVIGQYASPGGTNGVFIVGPVAISGRLNILSPDGSLAQIEAWPTIGSYFNTNSGIGELNNNMYLISGGTNIASFGTNGTILYMISTNSVAISNKVAGATYLDMLGSYPSNNLVRFFTSGTNSFKVGVNSQGTNFIVGSTNITVIPTGIPTIANPVIVGTLTASNASVGTAGQVLTSGGTDPVSWTTLSSGNTNAFSAQFATNAGVIYVKSGSLQTNNTFYSGTQKTLAFDGLYRLLAGDGVNFGDATQPLYSFATGGNYGMDLASGGYLIFSVQGNERGRVDGNGIKAASSGTVGNPSLSFTTSSSSGLYTPWSGTVGISAGGILSAWATNSTFIMTNAVLNGTLTASNSTVGTAGQVLTSGGAGNQPSWTTIAGGASLDAVTADVASSAIANGLFTNQWTWTNNTAATASFALKFGLGNATSRGLDVREIAASTGGSGSQYLANFETAAASTASPWRVATRGTEVIRVSHATTQLLAADGSSTVPTYGFSSRSTAGTGYISGGPQIQYDSTHYIRIQSSYLALKMGTTTLDVDENLGISGTVGGSSTVAMATGWASSPGFSFLGKVNTANSGTVTLTTAADSFTAVGSGTIQNATGAVTYALPASPAIGDTYTVIINTGSTVTIDPDGASQVLRIGSSITTANTGTATSSTQGSTVTFVYISSNLWIATSYTGVWILT